MILQMKQKTKFWINRTAPLNKFQELHQLILVMLWVWITNVFKIPFNSTMSRCHNFLIVVGALTLLLDVCLAFHHGSLLNVGTYRPRSFRRRERGLALFHDTHTDAPIPPIKTCPCRWAKFTFYVKHICHVVLRPPKCVVCMQRF